MHHANPIHHDVPEHLQYSRINNAEVMPGVTIGSMLSHGASVTRGLGLPCVINTGTATATIRTGDRIRIDGSVGTVDITERAAA